ncbi:hypothetical protein [Bradyrhizobium sp. SHOUNA76]|uniref:hypothetical protein n=1 Tax=Bradyrhizobium sp. SHOUNA76 TaxID=2908927 RepID=UPI001FF5CA9A|nr:hypothetical protein [Bradyrhizobium sp. SHOUNA76]MCJ9701412.1 hypothetical protein [Bradyrhizobium sp. SHOUNA76]
MSTRPLAAGRTAHELSQHSTDTLLMLYLLGAYTGVSIYSGTQILVPSVACIAIAGLLYCLKWPSVPRRFISTIYALIVMFTIQYAISAFGYGDQDGVMLRATINQIASILVGFSLVLLSFEISAGRFSRVLKYFWLFLVIGATLEQFAGIGMISDAFRSLVYPKSAYVADIRDVQLFGGVRPKVFSLEPSFVGIWFTATMAAWLACTDARPFSPRFYAALVTCLWMGYVVRSSTIAFVAPLYVAQILLLPSSKVRRSGDQVSRAVIAAGLVGAFILVGVIIESLPRGLAPEFVYGDSVYGRLIAPRLVTQSILADSPIIGTGLGNQDTLFTATLPVYLSNRLAFTGGYLEASSARSLITNSFFLHWIYLGIVFGLIAAAGYVSLLRSIQIESVSYVVATVSIIWFSIGGYVTVQCWTLFFLFAIAARYRDREFTISRQEPDAACEAT